MPKFVEKTRLNAWMGIRWKMVMPFLIITALVVAVLLPITTTLVARRIETEADRRLAQIAESVAALIESKEGQALLSANFVANLPEVEEAVTLDEAIGAALKARKEELGLQELSYYGADFQPGDSAVFYGGPVIPRLLQMSEQTNRIRDALILEVFETGQAVSGIAIAPQSSQIIGVSPVKPADQSDTGATGAILSAFYMDAEFIKEVSEVLGADVGVVKDNSIVGSTIDRTSGYELLLQEGFIEAEGGEAAQNIEYGDGIQQRLLAHPLILGDEPQGTVLVAQPLNDLLQVRQNIQFVLFLFAGTVAVASLIFGIASVLSFARPLTGLAEATKEVSAGKLEQRVDVTHIFFKDEITELSVNFNTMTEHLQGLYSSLEQRAREQERIEHELRVARSIQQQLLPKEIPTSESWRLAAYYQPAYAVGGDFYDFLNLPDERLGLIIGDVTDKGMPAALVMATTLSMLRAAATQLVSPGSVLERVNDLLCPDIPHNMYVTCLYAVLYPTTGRIQFANAGHNPPCRWNDASMDKLLATGMPLGLMPDMSYEEKEATLVSGERVLFYSDGLVEAHNPDREMFSLERLQALLQDQMADAALIEFLLADLARFTGGDWEQEDDVTLVTLQRS